MIIIQLISFYFLFQRLSKPVIISNKNLLSPMINLEAYDYYSTDIILFSLSKAF